MPQDYTPLSPEIVGKFFGCIYPSIVKTFSDEWNTIIFIYYKSATVDAQNPVSRVAKLRVGTSGKS
jgi:hypothetical protein